MSMPTRRKRGTALSSDEIKAALSIDEDNLDKCWAEQPQLVFKFSEALAKKKLKREELKNELKALTSDLGAAIRKDPEEYGLEKLTEKAVEALIPSIEEYQELQSEISKLDYTINVYQSACVALEHRKYALRDLVALHGQQYFSEPSKRGLRSDDSDTQPSRKRNKTRRTNTK